MFPMVSYTGLGDGRQTRRVWPEEILTTERRIMPEPASLRVAECPRCRGTGWAYVDASVVCKCSCRASAALPRADGFVLPRAYEQCTFDTFEPKYAADRLAVMFARE